MRGRWANGARPPPCSTGWRLNRSSPSEQVRAEVMTLLLAGHETTAMALTWAWAAIDQAPAVRADLEAEWDAFGGSSSVGDRRTDSR